MKADWVLFYFVRLRVVIGAMLSNLFMMCIFCLYYEYDPGKAATKQQEPKLSLAFSVIYTFYIYGVICPMNALNPHKWVIAYGDGSQVKKRCRQVVEWVEQFILYLTTIMFSHQFQTVSVIALLPFN